MTRAFLAACLLPVVLGSCEIYDEDEIPCFEAEAHLAPCCPGLRLNCGKKPWPIDDFESESDGPCGLTLSRAERDLVIDLTCDEIRRRNYCSTRQLHRETGHWPCAYDDWYTP